MKSIDAAYQHCESRVRKAYDLLPFKFLIEKRMRNHFFAVLALYQTLESLEINGRKTRTPQNELALLKNWQEHLFSSPNANFRNAPVPLIAEAIHATHQTLDLSMDIWQKLITGMQISLEKTRYQTQKDLLEIADLRGGSIGELIFAIYGYQNEQEISQARHLGIAYFLTCLWQDIAFDKQNRRITIPLEVLNAFEISPDDIVESVEIDTDSWNNCFLFLKKLVNTQLESVDNLESKVKYPVRQLVRLIENATIELLKSEQSAGTAIFDKKPTIPASARAKIFRKVSFGF